MERGTMRSRGARRVAATTALLMMMMIVLLATSTTTTTTVVVAAYEWHAPGQRPEVTRRAIAGLWKVTPTQSSQQQQHVPKYPMKEFTVHPPKKKPKQSHQEEYTKDDNDQPELLLMLKEDGSFQEYASDDARADDDDESVEDSWKRFQEKQKQEKRKAELSALAKGTWDFRDGKLILAADRPCSKKKTSSSSSSSSTSSSSSSNKKKKPDVPHQDTLLEGRVVATYETSLGDNPVLETNVDANATATATPGQSTTISATSAATATRNTRREKQWDAHLAVPKGSVKVGKFFYPKHHPSFFDQPIYKPSKRGAFQLRQILGSLNTNVPDDKTVVEKFRRHDFYNKTFLLTSHPLTQRGPKGTVRWSKTQGKFVQAPPHGKEAAKYHEDMKNRPVKIRVMQVRFFPNNTFATLWGTGDAILRGKFDVLGQDSDQLWMHISRFGFGRSVSGSVFSEGRMLSQDDAKSYWGTIKYEEEPPIQKQEDQNGNHNGESSTAQGSRGDEAPTMSSASMDNRGDEDEAKKLEVRGSVLFGSGLEPMPVGRFIMRENDEALDSLLDDDDEEEEEEEEDGVSEAQLPDLSASFPDMNDEDGADLSIDDAFQ